MRQPDDQESCLARLGRYHIAFRMTPASRFPTTSARHGNHGARIGPVASPTAGSPRVRGGLGIMGGASDKGKSANGALYGRGL